jgi:signal peptidase II
MKNKQFAKAFLICSILLINVGCDQISKMAIRKKVALDEEISVIKNHFIITKVENEGAFLSLGRNLPDALKFILLSLIPLVVLIYASIFVITKSNLSKATIAGACFVIGGGLGNIYDRIIRGSVTDFLHLDFVIFKTGIFNFADVSIMTGFAVIVIDSFLKKEPASAQL